MEALLLVSLMANFFAGGAFIVVRCSPYNMRILACYLMTKSRAIMEIRRAKAGIEIERRISAQDMEKVVLPSPEREESHHGNR